MKPKKDRNFPKHLECRHHRLQTIEIIFSHTFVRLHLNLLVQKLCGLLNIRLGWMSSTRWRRISFEMVVGSLQRYLAISLKERPSFRESSIILRSSKVKCFWFPGIRLDICTSFYRHQRAWNKHTRVKINMQMNRIKWCERLNSTYVKVKSTVKWKSGI